MKQWTQHQPRAKQLLETDQFNTEQVAHRGSMAALDRSQLPALTAQTQLVSGALHKTWLYETTEQIQLKDTNVSDDQWQCATSDLYAGENIKCMAVTLTGHTGGMTYIEWSGMGFCNAFAAMSGAPGTQEFSMAKELRLRILVNGTVVAESNGLQQGVESFRVFGSILLPPGDHAVEAMFSGPAAGDEDPIETDSAPAAAVNIMLYHVVNMQLFALARYR